MSFGFGVGDFLAVLELANKVRQRWNDAPEEYRTMKDETKNVSVLLETVHKLTQQGTVSDEHIIQIKDSSANCLKVLQRCENIADKFPAAAAGQSSLKSKWKRLQLDPDDVRAVRDQLVSCVSSLNALLTAIQSFQMNNMSKKVDGIHDREAAELFDKVADWYSSDDFAKHHDYCLSLHLAGTGLWAINDPKYKRWKDGDTDTLLCPGIPGSGKSILHATLVDDLRTCYEHDESVVVIYFYCSFQRQAEQTVRNILSVLVRQLFQEHRHLPPEVKALYDKHCDRKTSASVDELEQLLHLLVQGYRKIFILMDAMDECMSNESDCVELLEKIFNLQQSKRATKLLATTRWLPHIIEHFGACPQLEVRAHQEDIELYLDQNIPRLAVKPQVKIKIDDTTLTIQDAVKSRIVDAADGMFLLARLQFDSLTDKTNPRKLQQALLQLHGGSKALELEYDKALLRIDQQREGFSEIAYKVLAWIVYARRELSIDELQEAVAIYEGMDDIDHDIDLEEEQQLASVCAGLVRVDHETGVMRLVHYTTQEYLERALHERNEGELSVARDCLTYLSMNVFKKFHAEDQLQKYKLFWYATKQWGNHIRPEFEQDLISYIDGLLFSQQLFQTATRLLFEYTVLDQEPGDDHPLEFSVYVRDVSPAHICAYFDMSSTISRIVDQGGTIDSIDSLGRTPLSWAAQYGHTEVVKVLLGRSDVSLSLRDRERRTPLHIAIVNGHLDTVEILLRHTDINTNWNNTDWETSLFAAVTKGHTDILRLLLQQKRVTAKPDPCEDSILLKAIQRGHIGFIKFLIEQPELSLDHSNSGAGDMTIGNLDKFKLLTNAIRHRSLELLKLLLEHPYVRNNTSALNEAELFHSAAAYGTAEIMKYLLSSTNGNPNTKNSSGQTPLCKALYNGPVEVGRVLLEHPSVNPESSDYDRRTPLTCAAIRGSLKIVKLLLQRSEVNPDSRDYTGRTPLSYAAENWSLDIVEALLQRSEVNPDSSDYDGRTPLSYAASISGVPRIVKLLLQRSEVDPESKDRSGRTPLFYAVLNANAEVVQCLLAQPTVQPNSKDHEGRTPLSHAAEHGLYDIVRTFLALPKVDMDTSDDRGLTPFLWAVKDGGIDVVRLFLRQWNLRSDSAEAYCILVQKAIQDLSRRREDFYKHSNYQRCRILEILGHCLLFLGYRDSALFAFQQVKAEQYALWEVQHGIRCYGCNMRPISGVRFVCMTCVDVDLCVTCRKEYNNGKILESCANHEFLEVPDHEDCGGTLSGSERVTKSLEDLNLARKDRSQIGSGSGSAVSAEWHVAIEERHRHW